MSRFVLDCSVTLAWCFEDEADRYADRVLDRLSHGVAVVPSPWPYEVVNVLLVAERRRRLKRADSVRFLALLAGLPIEVDPPVRVESMPALAAVAYEHGLSAYDAVYLDLAMRERLPLATRDAALRTAARAAAVAHFSP